MVASALAMLAPVIFFMVMIWHRRWTSDDGFINLRVIDNLLAGNGPVFNAGERVEAYTSALWVGIVALLGWFGVTLEYAAMAMSLLFAVAGLAFAQAGATTLAGYGREGFSGLARGAMVPLGALIYAVLPAAWDFGTSGLETGLAIGWLGFCFFLVARVVDEGAASSRAAYVTTLMLGLGPLVRPELAVFAMGFLLPVFGTMVRRQGFEVLGVVKLIAKLGLAMGTIPVAYQIFRMGYFAAVVPNTAIAKSAFGSRWEQGFYYAENFFGLYLLAIPLVVALGFWLRGVIKHWKDREFLRIVTMLVPTFCGIFHCFYVMKVGGDFMHGRLFLPALFGLLLPVAAVPLRDRTLGVFGLGLGIFGSVVVLAWAGLCATSLRVAEENFHGIGDERGWYARQAKVDNPVLLEDYEEMFFITDAKRIARFADQRCPTGAWGESMAEKGGSPGCVPFLYVENQHGHLTPSQRTFEMREDVAARGFKYAFIRTAIGMRSLYLGRDVYVVDQVGLSEPIAARLKLTVRRRPGHEKQLTNPWYIARFAAPTPGEDARITAARRALRCGDLVELQEAVEGPLTAGRFFRNMSAALRLHRLEIDPDPWTAEAEFCGAEPPYEAIDGGPGGAATRWECPDGYGIASFATELSIKEGALASIRPRCVALDGDHQVQGPKIGGSGEPVHSDVQCGEGERSVGIYGGKRRFIRRYGLICKHMESGAQYKSDSIGNGGRDFTLTCPEGKALVGVTARAGALVDAVGILCR